MSRRLTSAAALLALSLTVLTGCQSSPSPAPTLGTAAVFTPASLDEAPGAVAELVAGSRRLGTDLLAAEKGPNAVLSPWAVTRALGQVRLGALGQTAEQLDLVLGLPAHGRDEAFSAIVDSVQIDGPLTGYSTENPPQSPVVHGADGLFIDHSLDVTQTFIDNSRRVFDSEVQQVDFPDEASRAINAFADEHTGGLVTEMPPPEEATVMTILSTTFFASTWKHPFAAEDTWDETFTLADGSQVQTDTMHSSFSMPYASGPTWQAIDLPYSGDQVMRLVLPAEGVTLDSVLTDVTMSAADEGLASGDDALVSLSLPSWQATHSSFLTESLKSLGLTLPFTGAAELDGIAPLLQVTSVSQETTITVAEKGTVAASVVKVDMADSAAPGHDEAIRLAYDRPFVYSIVDQKTGVTLFMGRVDNPTLRP